jgi:hypothetical protein
LQQAIFMQRDRESKQYASQYSARNEQQQCETASKSNDELA